MNYTMNPEIKCKTGKDHSILIKPNGDHQCIDCWKEESGVAGAIIMRATLNGKVHRGEFLLSKEQYESLKDFRLEQAGVIVCVTNLIIPPQ